MAEERNPFRVYAAGDLLEHGDGSRIALTIRMHALAYAYLAFSSFLAVVGLLLGADWSDKEGAVAAILMLLVNAAIWLLFDRQSCKLEQVLRQVLRGA